ncbi:MAG: hypothetical protein DME22_12480 [Verrucomicrobia bacterium]|nr:MAG: hypothetical protein DME22_12480 [Verrucomicrobiota bacterium]
MKRKEPRTMPHEQVYARIGRSKIHGVGVFAIRDIPKGTKIFPDDDSELIWGETYGPPNSFNLMTVAWYLNHSKTPNVGCDKDYTFFALRDIKKGEELTADYHTYNEFANPNWI